MSEQPTKKETPVPAPLTDFFSALGTMDIGEAISRLTQAQNALTAATQQIITTAKDRPEIKAKLDRVKAISTDLSAKKVELGKLQAEFEARVAPMKAEVSAAEAEMSGIAQTLRALHLDAELTALGIVSAPAKAGRGKRRGAAVQTGVEQAYTATLHETESYKSVLAFVKAHPNTYTTGEIQSLAEGTRPASGGNLTNALRFYTGTGQVQRDANGKWF